MFAAPQDSNAAASRQAAGASPDREMILIRCPRYGTLYENTPDGEDMTHRLTEADAASLYPDLQR